MESMDDKKNTKEAKKETEKKELSTEEKLREAEDRALRALAELENQRRRFEKEIKEALEFGGFSFAKEILALLDNLQRAQQSIKNDETLKSSKDLDKFLKNIEVLEKDLISIFEKNNIKKINCIKEKFNPNSHQAMLEIEDEAIEPGLVIGF